MPYSSAAEERCEWRVWERISRGKKIYGPSELLRIKGHVAGIYRLGAGSNTCACDRPWSHSARPRFSRVSHGPDCASFGRWISAIRTAYISYRWYYHVQAAYVPHEHIIILYHVVIALPFTVRPMPRVHATTAESQVHNIICAVTWLDGIII